MNFESPPVSPFHSPLSSPPQSPLRYEDADHSVHFIEQQLEDHSLEITEGRGEKEYPAPWIWELIGHNRDNVISINYRPVVASDGGLLLETWREPGKHVDYIKVSVCWEVTYRDADGVAQFETDNRLIFTGIPMPSFKELDKEHDALQKVRLAIEANCVPVVKSMDPHQRKDELWNRIDDVLEARFFVTARTPAQKYANEYDSAQILFGPNLNKLDNSFTVNLVNSKRELIWTGDNNYCVGPLVTEGAAGLKSMQVDPEWAELIEPSHFGFRTDILNDLKGRPAAEITVDDIAPHFPKETDYLERLYLEIEHEKQIFIKAKSCLFETRSGPSSLLGRIKKSDDLVALEKEMAPGWKRWLLGSVGYYSYLNPDSRPAYAWDRGKLENAITRLNGQINAITNQINALPVGNAGRAPLETQREQIKKGLRSQEVALNKLVTEHGKHRANVETALALMQTLQASMEAKQAQLNSLLDRTIDQGGFCVKPQPPEISLLSEEEQAKWASRLSNIKDALEFNALQINHAKRMVANINQSFDDAQRDASVTRFADSVTPVNQRCQQVLALSTQHMNAVPALYDAYHAAPDSRAAKNTLLSGVGKLKNDQRNVYELLQEIDQFHTTLEHLLAKELPNPDRQRLLASRDLTRDAHRNLRARFEELGQVIHRYSPEAEHPPIT